MSDQWKDTIESLCKELAEAKKAMWNWYEAAKQTEKERDEARALADQLAAALFHDVMFEDRTPDQNIALHAYEKRSWK